MWYFAGFVGFKTNMHATIVANAPGGQSKILSSIQAGMAEIETRWTLPFRGELFRHLLPVRVCMSCPLHVFVACRINDASPASLCMHLLLSRVHISAALTRHDDTIHDIMHPHAKHFDGIWHKWHAYSQSRTTQWWLKTCKCLRLVTWAAAEQCSTSAGACSSDTETLAVRCVVC